MKKALIAAAALLCMALAATGYATAQPGGYSNSYTFDQTTHDIVSAAYLGPENTGTLPSYITTPNPGYTFVFFSSATRTINPQSPPADAGVVVLQFEQEALGRAFATAGSIGEAGQTRWAFCFKGAAGVKYQGLGTQGRTGDIDYGVMFARLLSNGNFEVIFNITFTDGKKLEGDYRGPFASLGNPGL